MMVVSRPTGKFSSPGCQKTSTQGLGCQLPLKLPGSGLANGEARTQRQNLSSAADFVRLVDTHVVPDGTGFGIRLMTEMSEAFEKEPYRIRAPNGMPLPRLRLVHADRDGSRRPDGARLPRFHAPAGQRDFRNCPTSPAFGRQAAGQPALL